VKRLVIAWMPGLGRVYRLLRDELAAMAPGVPTPFGFNLAGNSIMASGSFEKEEISLFLKYIDEVPVCVDIGANVGLYTCLAASHHKHVLAVEPGNGNLKLLYRNLAYNGFLDVEVFPLGLSDSSGIRRLFGTGVMASFVPGWAGAAEKLYEIAPVSTLDVIVGARFDGLPMLIKMDVEGFETEVLKGAQRTLGLNPKPIWLVEICLNQHFPGGRNEQFCQTFQVFWRHGYQALTADSEQRLIEPSDVNRWAQQGFVDFGSWNYIFS
jgi:FkbM family methyltransferase